MKVDSNILSSATKDEAAMADVAHRCLVSALDHSRAKSIELRIDGADAPVLKVPPAALRMFASILRQMAKRQPMTLIPQNHEMTTQEAANFLNVSRPFLVKELESGKLSFTKVGSHRRIRFDDLLGYRQQQQVQSNQALDELSALSQDLGLEL